MSRLLVVQHERSTGPGWWEGWLAAAGVVLDVVHPYAAQELPTPAGLRTYDGLLVLGGAMGPLDDADCPWLPPTRELLAAAVADGLPTFGICLGAELIVVACGGSVRRGPAGPELGVLTNDPTPAAAEDPVLSSLSPGAPVLQWHWEEMDRLPPGAVLLATSPAYRHQAFRLGPAAWGVQGHPEVTPEIAADWAREDSPLLLAAGREPADLVAEVQAATPRLVRTWEPVARAFAAVLAARAGEVPAAGAAPATRAAGDAEALPLLDDVLGRHGTPPGGATG